jgi:NAD(P)-dependent dehydrogenase (short-subunit alcohol dehydrogenase family)
VGLKEDLFMESLSGKRVVITGATSGIGRDTTLALLKQGAHVAFCGKSAVKMKELLDEIARMETGILHAKAFDVIVEGEIKKFVAEAREKLGGIDILVNCAGLNRAKNRVEDIRVEDLEYMIKVNFVAPFLFIREIIKEMRERQSGLVINIMSSACLFASEGIGAYSASKCGFDALAKALRKEVRKDHIGVCCIYPGGVDTPFRANARPDYLRPGDVTHAIIQVIKAGPAAVYDEIVLRPFVETNF